MLRTTYGIWVCPQVAIYDLIWLNGTSFGHVCFRRTDLGLCLATSTSRLRFQLKLNINFVGFLATEIEKKWIVDKGVCIGERTELRWGREWLFLMTIMFLEWKWIKWSEFYYKVLVRRFIENNRPKKKNPQEYLKKKS